MVSGGHSLQFLYCGLLGRSWGEFSDYKIRVFGTSDDNLCYPYVSVG